MANPLDDMVARARETVPELPPDEIQRLLDAGEPFHLLDVRGPDDLEQGILPGAQHASRNVLEGEIRNLVPDRKAKVVLYSTGGVRSLFAGKRLVELGYENVYSLAGGFRAWCESGYPVRDAI